MSPGDQAAFIAEQKAAFSLANYEFQMAALNSAAPLSAVANFSDPIAFTLPPALAITTATGSSSSSITLTWSAPTVVMNSATTGYAVRYRQIGATDWVNYVGAIVSPTATITGLAAATDYAFQVASINGLGQGAFGPTVPAKTILGVVTAAPDAVVVTSSSATGNSVTINFTAPDAHNSAITGYALAYRAVGAATWTTGSNLGAAAVFATVTGLTPGTAYEVKVAALNGVATTSGTANWMTPVSVTTLNYATAPVFGATSATATSIQVSWGASSANGGSAVTGYSLGYRVVGAGSWTLVTLGNVLTYQLPGLLSSTSYEFEIAAINGVGTGAYSSPTSVATQAAPVVKPAPVTVLFALNSAVLTAASQKSIKAWAAKVSKSTLITLDGYAAGTTVKKVKADSGAAAIAKARATAVAKYLKTLGWASSKIVGHGAATPVSKTDPNKNRRVVLSVK
jgi:outer membrane protein OmpA-like peptidoglycan-associated protein